MLATAARSTVWPGVVRAWLDFIARTPSRHPNNAWLVVWAKTGADKGNALDNKILFPPPFRSDQRLRGAILI